MRTVRSSLWNRPSRGREDELAMERDRRQKAEQERDDAIAARQEAEGRLQEMLCHPGCPEGVPGAADAPT